MIRMKKSFNLTPVAALLAPLFAVGLFAASCGEPPAKKTQTKTLNGPAATAPRTGAGTSASNQAPPAEGPQQKVDRSVLPKSAPEGAEILTSITPGNPGGQLVISIAGEPKTFNPLLIDDAASQFIADQLFAGLTNYDQYEQKDIPGLAYAWEYNKPTREWTFHLRKGLLWSDGQPLTSDDFIFSTQLIFDEKIPSGQNLFFRQSQDPKSPPYKFSAPDPYTFVAKIPGEDSFSFLNLSLLRALPRHVLEKPWKEGHFNEMWGQSVKPQDLVVCGPFKLKDVRSGESVILERNPHYHRYDVKGQPLPYLDQVVMLVVEDAEASEVRFFPAGDTDLLEGIKPDALQRFLDAANKKDQRSIVYPFTVYPLGPSLNINHYYFNLDEGGTYKDENGKDQVWQPSHKGEKPPANLKNFKPFVDPAKMAIFSNPEFRIACSEATDRQTMINTLLFGQGTALYGPESPSNKVWTNPNIPTFPYNPESAKKRLDKLGLIDRNGDGIREDAQGRPIRFTIVTNRENNIREKVAQQLKENLGAIGLGVSVQVLQFNNLLTRITTTFDFDCCLLGIATGVPPHPAMAGNGWLSSGRMHAWYPSQKAPATDWEEKLDTLYTSMKRTFDQKEQQKIYFEMQDIYARQQPTISLFTSNVFVAAKNKIGNLKPSVLRNSLTHNLDELYIKK